MRTTMHVQGEGYRLELRPGQTAVIGTADDVTIRYPLGLLRARHAIVRRHHHRWELADLDGQPGIYLGGAPVTSVELSAPQVVRLGRPAGPFVALAPLPRAAPGRWAWWLLAAALVLVPVVVLASLMVSRERTVDHRPFSIGTCIATSPHLSAGEQVVRPGGVPTDCKGRFDYKVVGVVPIPTPEVTAARGDEFLRNRARELTDGSCPPASWPALGDRDAHRIVHEVYCVQDSIYTMDRNGLKRGFQCIRLDSQSSYLATHCSQRHDYVVQEVDELADAAGFQGDDELQDAARSRCGPEVGFFVASKRTWAQGYRGVVCLYNDNYSYEDTMKTALTDLRAYWDRQLPDVSPRPSSVKVLDERRYNPHKPPRCGGEPLVDNAWYCSEGDGREYVAWDPGWLKKDFYDKYGDIAVAVVLAHEWGHVIQARVAPQKGINEEYQADCYAGVWLAHLYNDPEKVAGGIVPAGSDRNKAIHAIVDVGDAFTSFGERLEDTHGDALQRMQNLLLGFNRGRASCQTLEAAA
jgi:Putative neutral zinc metallopeptidase